MKDKLKDPQTVRPGDEKNVTEIRKLPYSCPALQIYGSVSRLTQGAAGSLQDGFTTKTSDPSVKENIVRIGVHPLGIGLYLFDYRPEHRESWGRGRQFGVMADEVEAVMPAAVSTGADGYKRVDYGLLGISHAVH